MSDVEPKWLDVDFIIEIHERVVAATGGSQGIRDPNLLESALNRSLNSFHYEGNANLHDLAAIYTEAIAKNHAFVDGNKRTAFLAAEEFLKENGLSLDPKYQDEFVKTIEGIADGTATRADLTALYEKASVPYTPNIRPPELDKPKAPDAAEVVADAPNNTPEVPDAPKVKGAGAIDDVAEGVKDISKLSKAGRLGANITGVGVLIGAGSYLLLREAHDSQRDFAGDLKDAGILDDEAYQTYLELNNSTENILSGDLALSTADPTGLSIIVTAGAEAKARSDFKEWADEHAPGLSEEQFQTLSMSIFPDSSARADLVWEARGQLPSTTEGQPENLHRAIELNALYEQAGDIHYSHKDGFIYSGDLSGTLAAAKNMGIEVEEGGGTPARIKNLREAIKQELVGELDQKLSNPDNIDSALNLIPVGDRMDYVRSLAASEENPEQFAKDHPEIAAYIKEYDESWTGWEWRMDSDDPLKANPELLNDYIKERTLPEQERPDNEHGSLDRTMPEQEGSGSKYGSLNQTPNGVIDRTSQVAAILPSDANLTVQSSDNNASVARGVVADDQIRLMQDDIKDPATLPEVAQQRELEVQQAQQRQQELVAQQAEQQRYLDQQSQPSNPTSLS